MLQILVEISQRLQAKEKVNPLHLDQLIEFMKVFVDGCHHAKEEDFLFPAMEKAGVPNEGGPIGMMLMDHGEERVYVKNLVEAVSEYKKGNLKEVKKIIKNIKAISGLLLPHIDKENNILYMIADMHLTKEDQNKLVKEFEKIEEKKVGKGKHEQFHKMLNQLKKAYL